MGLQNIQPNFPFFDKDQASVDPHGHASAGWLGGLGCAKPSHQVFAELIHSGSQGTNLTWLLGYSQALRDVAQSIRSLDLMALLENVDLMPSHSYPWLSMAIHDSEVPETVQPSGGLTLVHQDFQGPQTRTKTVTDPFIYCNWISFIIPSVLPSRLL